jgi:ech hydrogenase subunit F
MFDMLGSIFKNLTSKPATRMYPFEKREPFKDTRGQIDIDIDSCIFCGICSKKCPSDAIVVNKGEKSWELDPFKCVVCGVCSEVCPKKSIKTLEQYKTSAYKKEKSKHVQQPKPSEAGSQDEAKDQ